MRQKFVTFLRPVIIAMATQASSVAAGAMRGTMRATCRPSAFRAPPCPLGYTPPDRATPCPAPKRRHLAPAFASSSPPAPDAAASPAAAVIAAFHSDQPCAGGRLVIAPLAADEVGAASVVLTRAFATSPAGIPIDDGRQYCQHMVGMPPRGVLLVGRLYPTPGDPAAADWLPPGQTSRVVATAAVSFDPISRETFQTLQPPDGDAYLCNIAVDPGFRRRGVARRVLAAAEGLAAAAGFPRFYLHVRLGDEAARGLYDSEGYREVGADSWLVKLRGMTPASLMVKEFV